MFLFYLTASNIIKKILQQWVERKRGVKNKKWPLMILLRWITHETSTFSHICILHFAAQSHEEREVKILKHKDLRIIWKDVYLYSGWGDEVRWGGWNTEMNKCACNERVPRFLPLLQIVPRDHHPIKAMKSLCV